MSKTTYILALVILCSILNYGQQITFQKNLNFRANTLQQTLNEDENRLLLESTTDQIIKVNIFNDIFSESIDVLSYKIEIDLNTLPLGDFIIQAKLGKKWIIMYLKKKDDFEVTSSQQKANSKDAKIVPTQQTALITDETSIAPHHKSLKVAETNTPMFYWVITESNSSFGSRKTTRLEYKEDIDKLILKNKLELKSNVGKANKLVIYEVYNKSEFMDKQFRNPTYYTTEEASKFLNTKPLYASSNQIDENR